MVGARQDVIGVGVTGDGKCMNMRAALDAGSNHDGILFFARRSEEIHDIGFENVNVRIAEQAVIIKHGGCLPEHSDVTNEVRTVAVACPSDQALRCAGCILDIVGNGEELQDRMINSASEPMPDMYY